MNQPIGIFDSGLGGVSILREVHKQLPAEELLYIADQAHAPYGPRDLTEVRSLVRSVTRFLIENRAKLIVLACNTASAAGLHEMREEFPDMTFVGMEPAVKPAAEETRTGKVAVIATEATFQGRLYESVVERFADGVEVHHQTCPGLVACIEQGTISEDDLEEKLRDWLLPLKAKGIDRLVLGCTHYPLIRPAIERVLGPEVVVIDPAPAIARQIEYVLGKAGASNTCRKRGNLHFLTTGPDPQAFSERLELILDQPVETSALQWIGDRLAGE